MKKIIRWFLKRWFITFAIKGKNNKVVAVKDGPEYSVYFNSNRVSYIIGKPEI